MDEQTIRIIEAFAKMNANDDVDVVELAQRKVRTPEGVQKYDQPIGTIITKDMIEKAAKKAAQAATSSLNKQVSDGGSSNKDSGSTPSAETPKSSPVKPILNTPKITSVPGNQTTADLNKFYVSGFVNDPSKANIGWVQKKDGSWYRQEYENGQVKKETELTPEQANAIEAMQAKGLIHDAHIPDPQEDDEADPKTLSKKINEALASGKKVTDSDVSDLVVKLKSSASTPEPKEDKSTESKSKQSDDSSKTVEINGKQVKVGRYSRPKGFAKAFLIVQEDGQIFYEDKTGKRKKITAKSFENHQNLGMTKHLSSDTGPLKKDEHFENGKLIKDSSSDASASPAKVESMKTTTPEPKPSPQLEKPAQEAPKAAPAPVIKKDSDTVKIGGMTVKVGRYSRPKGFAKAFLIVHPDGTAEYEDKTGKRKKLTANAFKKNWELGMNKFLTSDTGAIKKGEHYEAGKLVNEDKDDNVTSKTSSSPVIQAAKEAAAKLAKTASDKAKQSKPEDNSSVEDKDDSSDKKDSFTVSVGSPEKATEAEVPKGSKVYVSSISSKSDFVNVAMIHFPNGQWWKLGAVSGLKKVDNPNSINSIEAEISKGLSLWEKYSKNKDTFTVSVVGTHGGAKKRAEVPFGSKVYTSTPSANSDAASTAFIQFPDGQWWKLGASSGFKKVENRFTLEAIDISVADKDLVLWRKYAKKNLESKNVTNKDFYVNIKGSLKGPVPEGSKVYVASFLDADTAGGKHVQTPSGEWYNITSSGVAKTTPLAVTSVEHSLKAGGLKDITDTEKKNLVSESKVVEPQSQAEEAVEKSPKSEVPTTVGDVKSVKILGMDIKPGKYSIGKSFAKAFLLVHPDGTLEYQNKAGNKKKLTKTAFQKNWDAGMNKYAGPLDISEGPSDAASKPSVADPKPPIQPGKYYFQPFGAVLDTKASAVSEVMPDGSFVMTSASGDKTALSPEHLIDVTSTGFIVDQYGNSVFSQGSDTKPKSAHLFGSAKEISLEDLVEIREKLTVGNPTTPMTLIKSYTGPINVNLVLDYATKYFPNQEGGSTKSFIKAIDDILQSAGTKLAQNPDPGNVPDQTKGLFSVDAHGYAVMSSDLPKQVPNTGWMSTSELNQLVKKISQAVGGGKILATAPSKMSDYGKAKWVHAFYNGDMNNMYSLEHNSGLNVNPLHPGHPNNKDTHKVIWAPAVEGELPAGVIPDGEWSADPSDMTPQEIDNYLIKANMAYPQYLDSYYKSLWVKRHVTGQKIEVDKLSLQARTNFKSDPNYTYSEKPVFTEGVKPAKPYDKHIATGESAYYWSDVAKKKYIEDFPEAVPASKKNTNVDYLTDEIDAYVQTQKAEAAAKAHAEYLESLKPKFEKAAGHSVSGGHHEAIVLKDQFGKKWIYKPRDEKNIFLADVEQEAHTLAKAWGYKTAKSFITEFDDRKGHVQEMFDAQRDLSGVSMSELNSNQITDIAKEHLLDWALDNDDSWGANLLQLKNGSIVGIDKGRAFAAIGHWNGLSGDSSAHVHMPLVYTDLYKAIANKTISQEDANAAYFAVIKQARKMEKLSDNTMRDSLERAFANRTNWSTTGGPKNKEEAIQAALDRKNSLVSDMEKLWGNVFSKAGYDKPEPPQNVVVNPEDQEIHLGITPALLEQAKANGSYGASGFLSGPEVEDSHILLFHAKSKTGVDMLHGEMKIRHETKAYKDVEKWLKDNATTIDNAYGYTPPTMKPTLPNEQDYFNKIIDGVKTISTHALDGQYNEAKLNGMSWVKNTLKNYLDEYDGKMADPDTQVDMVKQYKDPSAFREMAKKYLDLIAKAEQHKMNGTKSSPGEFTRYEWTPPKEEAPDPVSGTKVKVELRSASSAKTAALAPKFDEDGNLVHDAGYTTDGNPGSMYLVTLTTGETIEFRGDTTGTPETSKGLTRITFPAGADEAASIERIRAQLAQMGLNLNDASEDDLELFYWRHLARIMEDRADSKTGNSSMPEKFKKFHAVKPVETANMSAGEELEAWKDAFANLTSREQIDEFVGAGGHLPKFGHYHMKDPSKSSGQPYWERFDVTDDMWQTKQLPSGGFYDNKHAEYVTLTGGMLSTEARLRTLGIWKGGMSSSEDQSKGSAGFVFVRQNLEVKSSSSSYDMPHIFYSPKVLKRTHNYSFSGDQYGNMHLKKSNAFFDFDSLTQHKDSSNELMIKHSVSMLDDIEIVTFEDPALRQKVIDYLKSIGLDEIRGVPVEQRFVMRNKEDVMAAQKAVKEAWNK